MFPLEAFRNHLFVLSAPNWVLWKHTTSFRNSLAPFKGNFILDQWSVYGMHVFFLRNTYWKYLLWNLEHWRQNSMHPDYMRTEAIWSPQLFQPLGFLVHLGCQSLPLLLSWMSVTSLVVLYTWSFSYPRYCLVEHMSNLSLFKSRIGSWIVTQHLPMKLRAQLLTCDKFTVPPPTGLSSKYCSLLFPVIPLWLNLKGQWIR